MEVRHLALLRDVRARGTLAAVAAATHRTPSALSQQLRTAERELGVRLVEPDARGVRLTWAGEILADGAEEVLTAIASVQARLDAGREHATGTVRVGTLPSAGAALMPGLYAALRGTRIRLELEDFDLAEADFAGRTLDADFVIAHSLTSDVPAGAEGLDTRVLAREPIDVAVPSGHELWGRDFLRPEDVVGHPWIAVPHGFPFATLLERIETATGSTLDRLLEVRDNRLVESLVGEGVGLALLPRFSTPPSEAYRLVPLTGVKSIRSIVAIGRHHRTRRHVVGAVLEALETVGRGLR
ncbi:LysR family transcriptional regulator [Demequina sp. TTPB684]|uniref:LysR family transcriptional regulator n=1 Tax=unclassified Demequina TaxID=2620311 RepID=UPI001CF16A3A|nr:MULTISPECIES: LysR family transcriptional regulator [unclassified Demequina]MCB2414064.1 LysR family transcriptional regulator [Demequina sp. TTPB684]UPU89225.1 LysR family transcriptional regulator [Demequina sp. TMPB413]